MFLLLLLALWTFLYFYLTERLLWMAGLSVAITSHQQNVAPSVL